ncbi:hypothetical protein CTI12_AA147120 [Artemisia annua]|uniref:V-type proton ATPase proteolipid subunit n=1 Tax=Artemisia annua TaxID=35608 RepID=A0A2U1PIK6_ARTAN|nr:hypothetical protein CTI12_AA147120 [Artemisia annua]
MQITYYNPSLLEIHINLPFFSIYVDKENKDTEWETCKSDVKLYTEMWIPLYVDRDFSSCQAKELWIISKVFLPMNLSVSRVGRTSWKLYHKLRLLDGFNTWFEFFSKWSFSTNVPVRTARDTINIREANPIRKLPLLMLTFTDDNLIKSMGAAYGTAKSGIGMASMGVMRPELVMKSIVPVVMVGVLGI